MLYLIKFEKNGRRGETYVADEKTQEEIQELLDNGFEEVSEEDYQLLLGNVDGEEHIKTVLFDGGVSYAEKYVYVPSASEAAKTEADEMKSVLKGMAVTAMMMNLAGSDLEDTKVEYQSKLATLSDEAAIYVPEIFPLWSGNSKEYKVGDRVTYNEVLYKVLQAHTSQEGWTPTAAPSLYAKVLTSFDEILDWEQPDSTNAYMKGDKVRYNGKVYESLIDNNVWSPIGYPQGWKEVEE